jgi:hypothetical protein
MSLAGNVGPASETPSGQVPVDPSQRSAEDATIMPTALDDLCPCRPDHVPEPRSGRAPQPVVGLGGLPVQKLRAAVADAHLGVTPEVDQVLVVVGLSAAPAVCSHVPKRLRGQGHAFSVPPRSSDRGAEHRRWAVGAGRRAAATRRASMPAGPQRVGMLVADTKPSACHRAERERNFARSTVLVMAACGGKRGLMWSGILAASSRVPEGFRQSFRLSIDGGTPAPDCRLPV